MRLLSSVLENGWETPRGGNYTRGAEIFELLETLLGKELLFEGIRRFFIGYDGKFAAHQELFGVLSKVLEERSLPPFDFKQFSLWLTNESFPEVRMGLNYDSESKKVILKVNQFGSNEPFMIPLRLSFLDDNGQELMAPKTVVLRKHSQEFIFEHIETKPIPSLFRGISAPVRWLYSNYDLNDLIVLIKHDSDPYNRYRAACDLWENSIKYGYLNQHSYLKEPWTKAEHFCFEAFATILRDENISPYLKAKIIGSCVKFNLENSNGFLLMSRMALHLKSELLEWIRAPKKQNETLEEKSGNNKLRHWAVYFLLSMPQSPLTSEDWRKLFDESEYLVEKIAYVARMKQKFPDLADLLQATIKEDCLKDPSDRPYFRYQRFLT
jgi:hypothetical protein